MKNNSVRASYILKSAGIFAGSLIGSGFATGQELVQFFSAHGSVSIYSCILAMILFSFCGALFMSKGYIHELSNHDKVLNFYFGRAGKATDFLLEVFLFCVYIVMVSASGAIVKQCFGLQEIYGRVFCEVMVLTIVLLGTEKLSSVVGFLGIVIIAMTIATGIFGIAVGKTSLDEANLFVSANEIIKINHTPLGCGILYPAFNCIVLLVICSNRGSMAQNSSEAVLGGICGGILFGLAVLVMNSGFLRNIAQVCNTSIPSLVIASICGKTAGIVFSVLIILGIISASTSMVWNVCNFFGSDKDAKYSVCAVAVSVLAFFLSNSDFRILVNIIYPYSGYLGAALIIYTVIKQ